MVFFGMYQIVSTTSSFFNILESRTDICIVNKWSRIAWESRL